MHRQLQNASNFNTVTARQHKCFFCIAIAKHIWLNINLFALISCLLKSTEKSKEALDQTDKKPRVRVDEQGRPILTGIGGSKPKPKPKKKDEPKTDSDVKPGSGEVPKKGNIFTDKQKTDFQKLVNQYFYSSPMRNLSH